MLKKRAKQGPKDELDNATSWNRAFADVLMQLRWVEAFCNINVICSRKQEFRANFSGRIIKKFLKTLQGNVKDDYGGRMSNYTMEKEFATRRRLPELKTYLLVPSTK
jgi:hypothetical protein